MKATGRTSGNSQTSPGTIFDPPGAACRACGALISFRATRNDRWQPVDLGTTEPHGASCTARQRPAYPDSACHRCGSVSVRHEPGSGHHWRLLRCLDCGQTRWLPRPQ